MRPRKLTVMFFVYRLDSKTESSAPKHVVGYARRRALDGGKAFVANLDEVAHHPGIPALEGDRLAIRIDHDTDGIAATLWLSRITIGC